MLRSRTTALFLAVVLVATACDRTPVDPTDGGVDIATLLFGAEAARHAAAPLSLPSLVQAAVLKVYTEHGADAARAMVTDLRRLQDQASAVATADREAAFRHRRALQEEQVSIVLRVFGDAIVTRIIDSVREDAVEAAGRMAALDATQPAAVRARDLLAQTAELLTDAESATASGAYRAALTTATQAAGRLDALRAELAESLRVPALDELFDGARAAVAETQGDGAADALLGEYRRLQQTAQQAVRTGSRDRAHAALTAVRAEQIRVVLAVLGDGVVQRMLRNTSTAHTALSKELQAVRASGVDATRMERMLAAAADLVDRSRASLHAGDAAVALDLASHAAGLINTVRLQVRR